jgi:catechol-2,3-dioxygenase
MSKVEKLQFLSAVIIVSKQAENLCNFYRDILGISLEKEEHDNHLPHWGCTLGDLHFAIHDVGNFKEHQKAGVGAIKLAFTVFDIEKFVKYLNSKNIALLYPIQDQGFMKSTAIEDLDGNLIELTELIPDWYHHLEERRQNKEDVISAWKNHNQQ